VEESRLNPRSRTLFLAFAVGMVLADSSVVTLALPDILVRYNVTISVVARVLVVFNLALAVCALPGALVARRYRRQAGVIGLTGFAIASLVCGLAPSFTILLVARAGQAVFGAALVSAALEALVAEAGRAGQRAWILAGIIGAAIGPAAGGLLTQTLGWQAIFLVQAPLVIAAAPALIRVTSPEPAPGRAAILPSVALCLVSAALTAALFLLVILMIEGWRLHPATAAVAVSVMPLAAIASRRLVASTPYIRAASGCILVAGGLAALGVLPRAGIAWTIPPQLLIGVGLGFALAALTELALGSHPTGTAGGVTIAARHAGVVVAITLLTPIFTGDLATNRTAAVQAGAAILIDARVPVGDKILLARDVLALVDSAHGRLPDIGPAFATRPQSTALTAVRHGLQDQLDRGATHAFSRSFLFSALIALAALLPIGLAAARTPRPA
jgi:MFS family permease